MQITLNQVDIELAIREFITRKVQFEPGFTPVIDLKATRGPEGFTATIDLDEQTANAVKSLGIVEKVKTARATATTKAAPETATAAAQEPAATEATDAPVDAGEPADATGEAPAVEATSEADTGEAGAEGEGDATPPPTEQPKSLFANLGKPRNS